MFSLQLKARANALIQNTTLKNYDPEYKAIIEQLSLNADVTKDELKSLVIVSESIGFFMKHIVRKCLPPKSYSEEVWSDDDREELLELVSC